MTLDANTIGKPKSGIRTGFFRMPQIDLSRARAIARKRPYLSAAVAAALVALVGYGIYSLTASSTPEYTTATVTRGDIEDSVTALGNLQPRDYVDVGAQATGQLKNLYVNIGDDVKQGQLLAVIDPQVQTAKVAVDQGNVANLQAN